MDLDLDLDLLTNGFMDFIFDFEVSAKSCSRKRDTCYFYGFMK